jgi:hypothetical protein
MSSEASKTYLRGPEDWEDWETEFKTMAIDVQLWDNITDDEPLLEKPKKPQIASYQTQTRTRAGRSQTIEAEEASLPSEIGEQGRLAFQMDMQWYIQEEKEFKEQNKAVQKLRRWTMDTVASHYVRVACKPDDTINQWYDNLKKHVGITDTRGLLLAHEKYKEALKPLTKPKEWSTWIMN